MSLNKMREQLAQSFINALKEGDLPWEASWHMTRPENAITGKYYRGMNSFWLSFIAEFKGYKDHRWCTFKQAKDKGWHVKKDEKSTPVEFWSLYDKKTRQTVTNREADDIIAQDPDREKDIILMSRVYCVFNAEQIEGIPPFELKNEINIDDIRAKRDLLLKNMDLKFREQGSEAYYSPGVDRVTMPPEELFNDTYGYMATFLHECGHATGHSSRLNRDLTGTFGSEKYAREELRAEIASAFTAQALEYGASGITSDSKMQNHKAYIQSWIKAIENDPNELFSAIKDAEKISDYLLEKGEFVIAHEQEEVVETKAKPSLDSIIETAAERAENMAGERRSRQTPELVH